MTPRLSGHFSIFGLVFLVLKSLLAIARQWSLKKNCKPRSHVRILICRTGANSDRACPQNPSLPALYPVARDHCGTFKLIRKESGGKARSHQPSLALLACLGCSRVPQSPLSLGKACGEGSLTRLSLRLLASHQHPTFKVHAPCSLRRQRPYNLRFLMVSW